MARKQSFEEHPRKFRGQEVTKRNGRILTSKAGAKRAVNVSVDATLLKVAKEMGFNLSQTLEETLRAKTEEERIKRFREENKDALASYDKLIERAGVFGEELLDLE